MLSNPQAAAGRDSGVLVLAIACGTSTDTLASTPPGPLPRRDEPEYLYSDASNAGSRPAHPTQSCEVSNGATVLADGAVFREEQEVQGRMHDIPV
ncbi:MAG TPA: hypothetical protein VGM06_20685 [Polyangiaceae bacterium]|jgi:hypothetical protein